MSKLYEEQVVSMKFDNKSFEKDINTTLSSLDKLKEKLSFKGIKDGFSSISKSAGEVKLDPIGKSVDVLQAKFSALDVMAVTALANITTAAMNTGSKIIKSLTIDPILTGFQEYETKINAVQTIMANTASKGTTMADVTAVLDELNTYADKTIYNFAEMTRNIGTFTAAGVGLKDSASAIQGISNLAATSGSNAQQAATAMYQLSQALAAGTVKLMDWNSVVNAGMGGEKFQEALKQTAREHGIAVDKMIKKNGSFRDSLQEGWITADVLNTTLKKFTVEGATEYANAMMASGKYTREQADALIANAQMMEDAATKVKTVTQLWSTLKESVQSGWSQTWELIIGDFEDAKYLLSSISDFLTGIIGKSSESRNNLLKAGLGSRWTEFTAQINEAGISTDAYTEKVKELARQNGIAIDDMITEYGSLDRVLNKGKISSNILRDALKSFTATADGSNAKLVELRDTVDQTGSAINTMTEEMGRMTGRELLFDSLKNTLQPIVSILGAIGTAWRDAFPQMQGSTLYNIIAGFNSFTKYLVISERNIKNITNTFRGLFAILDLFTGVVLAPLNLGFKILVEVGKQLLEALGFVNTGILDITGNIGSVIASFRDWYEEHSILNRAVEITASLIVGLIRNIADFVKTLYQLAPVQMSIKAVTNSLDLMGQIIDIYFIQGAKAVHNLVENLMKMDSLTLDGVISAFKTFKEEFIDYITDFDNIPKDIMQGLTNGINDAKEGVFKAMREVGEGILEAIKSVLQIHSPSVKMTEIGKYAMEGFLNGVKSIFGTIFDVIGDFINSFMSIFNGIALGDVFIVGSLAGIFITMNKTLGVLKKFATPFEMIGDVFKSLSGVLDSVSGMVDAKSKKIKSEAILNIAKAIGILAGSLIALSLVDQGRLTSSLAILAGLAGALLLLAKVSEKVGAGGMAFGKLSLMMLSMSTSILIMSFALRTLSGVDPKSMGVTLTLLGGVLTAFLSVIAIYGKFVSDEASKSISKAGSLMLKLSISFGLMAIAVKAISLLSYEEMGKAAVFAAGVTVLFGAISIISRIAGNNADKAAKLITRMTVALGLMVGVAKLAAMLSYGELVKALTFVTGVGVLFAIIIGVTAIAGNNADEASKMILKIAVALGIVAVAVRIISGLSEKDVEKGINVVNGLLIMFGILIGISALAGDNADKAGNMLLKMSVAIGILAITIRLITDLKESEIDKGISVITKVGILFTAAIGVSLFAGRNADKTGNMLLKMSIAIGILAISIRLIGNMSMSEIDKGMKVINGVSKVFAAIMLMSAIAGNFSMDTKTMVFLTAYMIGLSGAIYVLAQLPIRNVQSVAKSLIVLLTGISASMMILSKVSRISPTVILGMTVMTLAVAGIAAVLGILSSMNISVSIETATSLSILLLAMSAACVVLSTIGATGPAAYIGIGALITLIAGLGTFIAAIGALNQKFPQIESFIDSGIPLLEKIAYAIGSFVGNIVGGFASGVMSGLPDMGTKLSEFMTNLQPFIDGCAKINPDIANSALAIAKTILILTAADVIEGLTSWITGDSSLSEFGKELAPFGKSLKEFANNVDGIKTESLTAATKAAEALGNMAASLPNSGGLVEYFTGDNNIVDFAKELVPFGKYLVKYSKSLDGLNVDAIKSSASAAKALSDVASSLPNSGGVAGWFAGENDLSDFGEELISFGKDISKYSSAVSDITPESVEAIKSSASAAKALSALASSLPNSGGAAGWFAGEDDLSDFGDELVSFGKDISKYSSAVADITPESVEASNNAAKIAKKIISTINSLAEVDTSGVSQFKSAINELSTINVDDLSKALSGSKNSISSLGSSLINNMISGINSKKESLNSTFRSAVNSVLTSLNDKKEQFKERGASYASKLVSGMKSKNENIKTAMNTPINDLVTEIRDKYSSFYSAGEYVTKGFAKGIKDTTYYAELKAKAMAEAAAEAAKKALDINSPSRVFAKIGEFAGLGFVKDLAKYIVEAEKTGRDIGNASANGLRSGIDALTDIGMPYGDIGSTITPMMDVSKIQDTLNNLSNAFRLQISADVVANVSSIDNLMSQTSQIDAILDKYTSKIDNMLRNLLEELQSEDDDKVYVIEVPLVAEGREIARASAKYMKKEIEKIDKRDDRKGGNK